LGLAGISPDNSALRGILQHFFFHSKVILCTLDNDRGTSWGFDNPLSAEILGTKSIDMNLRQKRSALTDLSNVPGICTGRELIEPQLPGMEPPNGVHSVKQERGSGHSRYRRAVVGQERYSRLAEQIPLFPGRPIGKTLEEIFGTPDFPLGRDAIMPPGTYGGPDE
jgi:hypothetical protein